MQTTKTYANLALDLPTDMIVTGLDVTCLTWGEATILLLDQGGDCPKLLVVTAKDDSYYDKWLAVRREIADCWSLDASQVRYLPSGEL